MRLDAESGYPLTFVETVYSLDIVLDEITQEVHNRFGWKRRHKASIGTLPLHRSEAASKMETYTKHAHRTLGVITIPVT